ncbi:MAG: SDR family oxidoreductase [Marmoricola sp.]
MGQLSNVLVTGASTGIGRAMTEYFADRNTHVFAGVRRLTDALAHQNVTPVLLDVTIADQVASAADQIAQRVGDEGLGGLVNNAGIAVGGPLEYVPIDDVRRQFEVNVVGQIAVTQAFLPLLRRAHHANVLFTGSISSLTGMPGLGPYGASKYALNGIGESLRRELKPSGIGVSVLICGNITTPIWDKGAADADHTIATLPPEGVERYRWLLDGIRKAVTDAPAQGIPPEAVAAVAWKVLTTNGPKPRYFVGTEAKAVRALTAVLPNPLLDKVIASQMRA